MGARILIVEDERETRDILQGILQGAGYSVGVCSTGISALAAIPEFKPDLLLLDVMLPEMDGYTLAQKVAAVEEAKNIPIIVLSALYPAEAIFRTLPQVSEFLTKPFTAQTLLDTVRKALEQRPC